MTLDFYFDIVCPFAYMASTRIEAIAAEAGATLRWHPILLGGVFRAIGSADVPASKWGPARQRLRGECRRRFVRLFHGLGARDAHLAADTRKDAVVRGQGAGVTAGRAFSRAGDSAAHDDQINGCQDNHAVIVEQIRDGKVGQAQTLLKRHIRETQDSYLQAGANATAHA